MGKQIVSVTFGVLGLIGVIVCCAVPQWIVVYGKRSNGEKGQLAQYGLWRFCLVQLTEQLYCVDFQIPPELVSTFKATRAMIVISCLLTCLSLLILLIQRFGANCIPYLQNEDAKPKIYEVVGVGLLLAGLLVIISVSWLSHSLEQFLKPIITRGPEFAEIRKGASVYVGAAAGVLLLIDAGLLCFGKILIQIKSVNLSMCRFS